MREFFALALTMIKAKDNTATVHIFINHIVSIMPVDGGTQVTTTTDKIVVKESVEDILRRAGTYGLIKGI